MHVLEEYPDNKRWNIQKRNIFVKLIYSIKTNMISNILSKFLAKVLRNSIKYVVPREGLGGLSGVLKVDFLRAMAIQSAFADDSFKWR